MLGQSFAPLGSDDETRQRQQQAGGSAISPVQEAIKLLSLRIPRFQGPTPIPQALLTAPGIAGLPTAPGMPGTGGVEGNPLQQLLFRMIQGGFGGNQPAGVGSFGAPPPRPAPTQTAPAIPPLRQQRQEYRQQGGMTLPRYE
jgi:hypothetical protein